MFTNETFFAIRSSSFLASCAFHASHNASSTLTSAFVLASGVAEGAALEAVFELAAASLFSGGFLASGFGGFADGGRFFGSMIKFSPWKTACHLSPLRIQMLAERIGLGTFIDLPSGSLHVPSQLALYLRAYVSASIIDI